MGESYRSETEENSGNPWRPIWIPAQKKHQGCPFCLGTSNGEISGWSKQHKVYNVYSLISRRLMTGCLGRNWPSYSSKWDRKYHGKWCLQMTLGYVIGMMIIWLSILRNGEQCWKIGVRGISRPKTQGMDCQFECREEDQAGSVKIMGICKDLEKVSSFKYLGSVVTEDRN